MATDFIVWLLTAALYSPTILQLYSTRWAAIDYTHAYFVLPASLFFVWRKRQSLPSTVESDGSVLQSLVSLALLSAGLALFVFSWKLDYLFLSALSLFPVLCGLILHLYGPKTLRMLAFPIAFLLFLVPPPLGVLDELTLPMRHGVCAATVAFLKLLGFPISRQGLMITVGQQEIFLEAACSGFRSLISLASIGGAYIYLSNLNSRQKRAMTLSIIPLALAGNWLRVVIVCVAAFFLGESETWVQIHDFSGYALFAIMMAGLFGVESLFKKSAPRQT